MTTRKYSSRSQQTTLAFAITSSDTSIQVKSASTLIPGITLSSTDTYTIVIDPDTALEEIVDVYSYTSGNTLVVNRAQDGSPALAHSAGAVVRHMAIGRDLRESIRTIDAGTVTNTMLAGSIAPSKVTGTAVTAADTGTVTNTMLAGSIAENKHQLVKISSGSIGTGSNIFINFGASGLYRRLFVFVTNWSSTSASATLGLRLNNVSTTDYLSNNITGTTGATYAGLGTQSSASTTAINHCVVELCDGDSTVPKLITSTYGDFRLSGTGAVGSITLLTSAGAFDSGTYEVYGQ
jgi:hypothetical protein